MTTAARATVVRSAWRSSSATAYCAQGLEFVWDDGSHAYPDDYPADGEEVVVTGVFETYAEGEARYLHLVNANVRHA